MKKFRFAKYPVKMGFSDGSGKEEYYITDAQDATIISGQGDCCKIGGIRAKNIAEMLVNLLNTHRPKFKVSYSVEEKKKGEGGDDDKIK